MKSLKKIFKVLFPICVIVYIIYRAEEELRNISIKEVLQTAANLNRFDMIVIVIFGTLSVLVMSLYDDTLVRAMKITIPKKKYIKTAFIASSINSIMGFGGLAGASLRHVTYRSYTNHHKDLMQSITWMTTSALNGLSFFSILILLHVFPATKLLMDKPWMFFVIIGMALFLPFYFILAYINRKKVKSKDQEISFFSMNIRFTLASIIEWAFAAIILIILLQMFDIQLSWRIAMGIFIISAIVGVISFVPGGFGSFDLTYLLGMSYYGVAEEDILSVILLYRIVYYIIPFLIALLFTVFEYTGITIRKVEDKPIIGPAIETTGVVWAIYRDILSKIGYWALSILVLYAAWLNITSVLIVPVNDSLFNKAIFDLCYNIILTCSVILILNIKGIFHRTRKSFLFVSFALSLTIIAHLAKSLDYHEVILLGIVLAVLLSVHKQFIVEDMLVTFFYYIRVIILGLLILALYFYFGTILSTLENTEDFRSFSEVIESTVFSLIFVPFIMIGGSYLFNRLRKKEIGEEFDCQRFKQFLTTHIGNSLTYLGFMGDKRMFFSSDGKALILFRKYRNRLIVLGDPSGDPSSYVTVLTEFMNQANQMGYLVVFYQIDQKNMHLYHDFGYQFFKLGEEAYVNIDEFSLSGKKKAGLRATFNRFEREAYQLQIKDSINDDEYAELQSISKQWLGKKKEKGFSIGEFNRPYINASQIAILRNANNEAIAFATIMPMYEKGKFSIDLMRYLPDAPVGTMDAMLIYLFQYAKEQGFHYFNLGMAPLSNVGTQNDAFFAERIAANVFNNVRYMYSFSGLRKFKEKYHPQWQGKYLTYRKNKTLVASMILVTRMISKGNSYKEKNPNQNPRFTHRRLKFPS
ncbi:MULTISPECIES: bifunctional lysylphosphatidylglycerol flippase/synthetase MprF [Bacillus]|uniref:bifunctional lysylphosphatidylglycerol flippase/synthetase MprF n=1 Tax=Bacillus TaxID=1386 RepID=UPI000307A33E|nr:MULTISPECIES: bifunctional lysylphosphatidylglycerol flippase/synthetase MprF [Bacillus]